MKNKMTAFGIGVKNSMLRAGVVAGATMVSVSAFAQDSGTVQNVQEALDSGLSIVQLVVGGIILIASAVTGTMLVLRLLSR